MYKGSVFVDISQQLDVDYIENLIFKIKVFTNRSGVSHSKLILAYKLIEYNKNRHQEKKTDKIECNFTVRNSQAMEKGFLTKMENKKLRINKSVTVRTKVYSEKPKVRSILTRFLKCLDSQSNL